ncbi:hypothetical protein DUI87_11086 [Hirundo rustica rustica]|uniref:Uncharacterized protein n=1 Tax=Hirundo rustica rustica TaxID=333673 RepID=A0A3M0KFN5_HIRRU|nr:hypothetical protein DUI87_11086 [Hirundo rustica rustica]
MSIWSCPGLALLDVEEAMPVPSSAPVLLVFLPGLLSDPAGCAWTSLDCFWELLLSVLLSSNSLGQCPLGDGVVSAGAASYSQFISAGGLTYSCFCDTVSKSLSSK